MGDKLQVPAGRGEGGAAFWNGVTGAYALRIDERRLLEDSCAEIDLIDRLEAALRDEPLMVKGSMGQLVASPLVTELRQHRAVLRSLLAGLKLPDEERHRANASDKARRAAHARWRTGV